MTGQMDYKDGDRTGRQLIHLSDRIDQNSGPIIPQVGFIDLPTSRAQICQRARRSYLQGSFGGLGSLPCAHTRSNS